MQHVSATTRQPCLLAWLISPPPLQQQGRQRTGFWCLPFYGRAGNNTQGIASSGSQPVSRATTNITARARETNLWQRVWLIALPPLQQQSPQPTKVVLPPLQASRPHTSCRKHQDQTNPPTPAARQHPRQARPPSNGNVRQYNPQPSQPQRAPLKASLPDPARAKTASTLPCGACNRRPKCTNRTTRRYYHQVNNAHAHRSWPRARGNTHARERTPTRGYVVACAALKFVCVGARACRAPRLALYWAHAHETATCMIDVYCHARILPLPKRHIRTSNRACPHRNTKATNLYQYHLGCTV